jgi:hypothetical protein
MNPNDLMKDPQIMNNVMEMMKDPEMMKNMMNMMNNPDMMNNISNMMKNPDMMNNISNMMNNNNQESDISIENNNFKKNDKIIMYGLSNDLYNNKIGFIQNYNSNNNRYIVFIEELNKTISLKESNIRIFIENDDENLSTNSEL